MLTLKDYVNWGITHSDKTGSAEGVPLVMENCVKSKKMKQLEVYGNSIQNGTPTPENPIEVESVGEFDADVGKYKVPVVVKGKNIFDCITSKILYYGQIKNTKRTSTGISYTANALATHAHMDLGLASEYVGKTLTASFDIELMNDETLGSTRFVVCNADGSDRVEVSKQGTTVGEQYCVTTTLGSDYGEKHLALRLYVNNAVVGQTYEFKNIMVSESATDVPFEPYTEPITTNVYLNEPLGSGDVLNFKDKKVFNDYGFKESVECNLPTLIAKTSIVEIGTTVAPSNMKGKYIKR